MHIAHACTYVLVIYMYQHLWTKNYRIFYHIKISLPFKLYVLGDVKRRVTISSSFPQVSNPPRKFISGRCSNNSENFILQWRWRGGSHSSPCFYGLRFDDILRFVSPFLLSSSTVLVCPEETVFTFPEISQTLFWNDSL